MAYDAEYARHVEQWQQWAEEQERRRWQQQYPEESTVEDAILDSLATALYWAHRHCAGSIMGRTYRKAAGRLLRQLAGTPV